MDSCHQVAAGMERNAITHEAWVANLVPPPEALLTPAEGEREAMIARRHQFIESVRDSTMTGERIDGNIRGFSCIFI